MVSKSQRHKDSWEKYIYNIIGKMVAYLFRLFKHRDKWRRGYWHLKYSWIVVANSRLKVSFPVLNPHLSYLMMVDVRHQFTRSHFIYFIYYIVHITHYSAYHLTFLKDTKIYLLSSQIPVYQDTLISTLAILPIRVIKSICL